MRSNEVAATISNSPGTEGLASSQSVGNTTITATFLMVSGTTNMTVTAATLESITVEPVDPTFAEGTQLQFSAIGSFDNGTTQDITNQVGWTSTDTGVVSVSNAAGSDGLATGNSAGTATITASFQGISGTSDATVVALTLQSITVTPADSSIPTGSTQQMTATGNFSDGSMQDITDQVTWTSSDDTLATVGNGGNNKGLASGQAAGTVTLTATLGMVSGTTMLTVVDVTLSSIVVTPMLSTIDTGETLQFMAVGTYSDNSMQDITDQVVWSSSSRNIAGISNAPMSKGLATGISAGMTSISATLDMQTGMTDLTVTVP